jgi:hypothetical protein
MALKFIQMSNFILDKFLITKKILEIIKPEYTPKELKTAMTTWWKNIRSDGGLGLTDIGMKAFQLADIDFSEFECKSLYQSQIKLKLDRYLLCPYSEVYKKGTLYLRIYDERIAVLINLYGNVDSYIQTLSIKRKELK